MRILRNVGAALAGLLWLGVGLWCGAAIWFRAPLPAVLRIAVVGIFVALALAAALCLAFRRGHGVIVASVATIAIFGLWYSTVRASNDRDWISDVARPPVAKFDGDLVTISNVRNFEYRSETDYTEHWEERTFDLSKLEGVDLFLSYWGSPSIAHTIASWEFADSPPLAISIETRKEKGEVYSSVRGFFREYELYYVVADERDLIGLRTNHRGEHVYLYRVRIKPENARALLVDYLHEANRLATEPKWYNALTHNCTTAIWSHVKHISAGRRFDWRILVNGYLDQMMYERGTINTTLPFPEMRALGEVTERGKAAGNDPSFSEKIRVGIPPAPPAPK